MKQYVVDGTVLFTREPTGRKFQGYRIPSFKERFVEGKGWLCGFHSDISSDIPDPIPTEVAEVVMRPATEEEYEEWRSLDKFTRSQSTAVWQPPVSSIGLTIIGVTTEWSFDPVKYPDELMPGVVKTELGS